MRFIALIWDDKDPRQSALAAGMEHHLRSRDVRWDTACGLPGLLALHKGAAGGSAFAHPLAGDGGVVLGTLCMGGVPDDFRLVDHPLPVSDCAEISRTNGRALVEKYWGSYVALLRDPQTTAVRILRDPSGTLPCYVAESSGVVVVFSHATDLLTAVPLSPTLNWAHVAAMAARAPCQTEQTLVREISELIPGECATVRHAALQRSFYWNPVDIARTSAIENSEAAARQLAAVVAACVRTRASEHPYIVHALSGGLDSSIVARCLAHPQRQSRITCVNLYSDWAEGDERRYARLVVRDTGHELAERLLRPESVDLRDADGAQPTLARPSYALELLHGEFETETAERMGTTAFFQGAGGDAVFLQTGASYAPGDFVYRHGLRRRALAVAGDAARVTGNSAWSMLRSGVVNGRQAPRWNRRFLDESRIAFLRPDIASVVIRDEMTRIHPLLAQAEGVPEGKLCHIFFLASPLLSLRPFERFDRPDIVFPLISQPVQELCLRIPTYLHFTAGWDRAIARRAFEGLIPKEVVMRRGKGGGNLLMKRIFEVNAAYIRDCLLGGLLEKEGIVDRTKIEAQLRDPASIHESTCHRLLRLWEVEAFVRCWHRTAP